MNKKVTIIIVLLLPIFLGGSCESRLFKFQSNIDFAKVYTFDKVGPTKESAIINEEDIRSALDLPSDATVTKVNIETLSLRIKLRNGNEAKLLKIKGFMDDGDNTKLWEIDEISPPIIAPDAQLFGQKIGINGLIETGINKFKNKIEGIIKQNNFASSFFLNVEVDSYPIGGSRIAMDIEIITRATIEYEQCVEVWNYLDAGEECIN